MSARAPIQPPPFVTYAPTRIAGDWRMHATVGHLRNSLRQNQVEIIFRLLADGTWRIIPESDVWKDGFA